MDQLLFVLANVFAATAAWAAADLAMKNREPWRRALAMLAGFPIVILTAVLSLGTLNLLSAPSVTALVGLMAGGAVSFHWWATRIRPRVRAQHEREINAIDRFLFALSLALLAGFGGMWLVLIGIKEAPLGPDDLSYHAPAIAHWKLDGKLSLAPFNYHAYYPFNAEVVALWFTLPFRADGSAGLSGLQWGLLLVGAGIAIVMAQGHDRSTGMFVGALLLAIPVLFEAARTFSAVDLAAPALVMAAIGLTIPSNTRQSVNAHVVDAAYSGLLAGFAVGCKVSFAPILPVLLLWNTANSRRHYPVHIWLLAGATFVLAAALMGSYWYIRNWMLTGNPLFPAAIGRLDGPFGPMEQSQTKLLRWIIDSLNDPRLLLSLVRAHTDWPFGLFLVAAVGYGSGVWQIISRIQASNVHVPVAKMLLLTVGFSLLVTYPFVPFTGTTNEQFGALAVSQRYLIAPFVIGVTLFAYQLRQEHPQRLLWLCVAILAAVTAGHTSRLAGISIMAAGGSALWLTQQSFIGERLFHRTPLSARALLMLFAFVLVAALDPYRQRLTDATIAAAGTPQHPIGRAWQAINALPSGVRVAWFGPNTYQYYPMFGRNFQLIPTPVNDDGSPFEPVHTAFRRGRYQWWRGGPEIEDINNLERNLIATGIHYVFVTKWNQEIWPRQQQILKASTHAHAVYDDGNAVIWKLGSDVARKVHNEEG